MRSRGLEPLLGPEKCYWNPLLGKNIDEIAWNSALKP
jgi:hypothetical protein